MTSPYMPLFVGDYLADTAHLSAAEHGAYLLLIMTYWQRGEPLPDNDRRLARIARMSDDEWAASRQMLSEFFEVGDGAWVHRRVERELEVAAHRSAQARKAARASVNARAATAQRPISGRSADAQQAQERAVSLPEPVPEYTAASDAQARALDPSPPAELPDGIEAECRTILGAKAPPERSGAASDFGMLAGFDRADVLAACRDWAADPTQAALRRWKPLTGWARSAQDARLASAARVASAGRAAQRAPPVPKAPRYTMFDAYREMMAEAESG